ncbi:MAG: nickel pincer cofactor biosynthesis protein LarB [Bacteroidota bacterium]
MNEETLRTLLESLRNGDATVSQTVRKLKGNLTEDLGFAMVDHHRELRQGFPEVIFSEGKTPSQVASIARQIVRHGSVLLATRADKSHFAAVRRSVPKAHYHPLAHVITAQEHLVKSKGAGSVLVVTAGTSDIPVAEEARITIEMVGHHAETLFDVGVAGIHRLLQNTEKLGNAKVIIVVAGMEGALASVVGGLVSVPVIAVPTSVGYGASFGGVTALLAMLNSCVAGVTVVNIDNGFGAAMAACKILNVTKGTSK